MEKLKINVTIADRTYPLYVGREEEEGIREAVKRINEQVTKYAEHIAYKDKQDLLAMVALQFTSDLIKKASIEQDELELVLNNISDITTIMTSMV